ncbi:MAG: thrombospondin type 3 repeat-containing protein [Polyangiales bacterium]
MRPVKRAIVVAAMLGLLLTRGRVASAFPTQPVIDSFWSSSMPWIVIPDRGNGTMQVLVNLDAPDCSDPVTTRNTASASGMCPSAAARDVIVHVFAEGVGAPNEVHAWRCQSAMCNEWITLPATATQRIALMVHGGPTAVGRQHGTLSWANGTSTGVSPLSLAGNVMVDVSNPPASNYDAETVLMPDVGNLPNDDLGADTTEVWILRDDLRVIRADVEGSGVGDAGRIALAATPPAGSTEVARWVVARPATPLPFQLRGEATYIPTAWPGAALDPSALHNAGRMRLILNARYGTDDADYDGLSNAVEQTLGTCDGLNPFPTSASTSVRCTLWSSFAAATNPTQFMDPRDTDGDGLSDGAEVLGSDRSNARNVDALGVGLSTVSVNTGVSETFPRWGFSPLHKDILVEIDMGIEGLSCNQAQPRQGCYPDPMSGVPVTIPQKLRPADAAIWPLENWMNSLRVWHDRFAVIPSTRANNPDGIDGINVHFDVRSAAVATMGHGMRAAFNPFPSNLGTDARPGLIIYIPGQETSGSTCSCGGLMNRLWAAASNLTAPDRNELPTGPPPNFPRRLDAGPQTF